MKKNLSLTSVEAAGVVMALKAYVERVRPTIMSSAEEDQAFLQSLEAICDRIQNPQNPSGIPIIQDQPDRIMDIIHEVDGRLWYGVVYHTLRLLFAKHNNHGVDPADFFAALKHDFHIED